MAALLHKVQTEPIFFFASPNFQDTFCLAMFWSFVVVVVSGAVVAAVGVAPNVVSVVAVVAVVVVVVGVQNGDKAQKRLVVKIQFSSISCN